MGIADKAMVNMLGIDPKQVMAQIQGLMTFVQITDARIARQELMIESLCLKAGISVPPRVTHPEPMKLT